MLYDSWKKQLLGSASRVFEDRTAKPSVRKQRHEAENPQLKNVIAEITAENLKLKKGAGTSTKAQRILTFSLSPMEPKGKTPPEGPGGRTNAGLPALFSPLSSGRGRA